MIRHESSSPGFPDNHKALPVTSQRTAAVYGGFRRVNRSSVLRKSATHPVADMKRGEIEVGRKGLNTVENLVSGQIFLDRSQQFFSAQLDRAFSGVAAMSRYPFLHCPNDIGLGFGLQIALEVAKAKIDE